jgi:hypothetical protein
MPTVPAPVEGWVVARLDALIALHRVPLVCVPREPVIATRPERSLGRVGVCLGRVDHHVD